MTGNSTRTWTNDISVEPLATLLNAELARPSLVPRTCPICQTPRSVHLYLHRFYGDVGGAWIWCSSCRRYDHDRRPVPEWWHNSQAISLEVLASPPIVLDEMSEYIDRHWNELRPSESSDG